MFFNGQNTYNDPYRSSYTPFNENPQQRYPYYQSQYQPSSYTSYQPSYQSNYQPQYYNQYPHQVYNRGYQPTYQQKYNPYEEEILRRQQQRMAEEQEQQYNQRYQTRPQQNIYQNTRPFAQEINQNAAFNQSSKQNLFSQKYEANGQTQKNPFEQMKFQNDNPFQNNRQQQTNQQAYFNTKNMNKNNEIFSQDIPKVFRIDSKTIIEEEKIDYQKEVCNTQNKNNLKDGLIEERYPDEIEQKAEKLSEISQKDYSYCLQIVLNYPNKSLGQYIDMLLNKDALRNQK